MNHFDPSRLPEVEVGLSEDILVTLVIGEKCPLVFPTRDVSTLLMHGQLPPTQDREWGSFSRWASTDERYRPQLSSLASILHRDLEGKHHRRPRMVWIHQEES